MPFEQVDFAEDAVWADQVIRAGYKIIFEPQSRILHSHDYNPVEQFRQNVDHAHAMYKLFRPAIFRDEKMWLKQLAGIPLQVYLDWKYMRSSEYFIGEPYRFKLATMALSPAWQLATVSGGWVGAHLEDMPPVMKRLLSRQERIKQS